MTKTTAMIGENVVFGSVTATTVNSGSIVKNNFSATAAPSTTDDSAAGYAIGSEWIDTVAGSKYWCADASPSSAVWKQVGSGSSPAPSPSPGRTVFGISEKSLTTRNGSIFSIPSGSADFSGTSVPGYYWIKVPTSGVL